MITRSNFSHTLARQFSNSCRVQSNIGKSPIAIPSSVTVTSTRKGLSIAGPLGTTTLPIEPFVQLTFADVSPQPTEGTSSPGLDPSIARTISVSLLDPTVKTQRMMWGTTRTHIANAITGVTEGFTVPLFLVGVGYRASLEDDPRGTSLGGSGKRLNMKVGFSHNHYVPIPPWIDVEVPAPTKIVLKCLDKQKIGLFAASVRQLRKPEPYKGKVRRFTSNFRRLLS